TLLIERLLLLGAGRAIGYDIDAEALACARANVSAAGLAGRATLFACDAGRLPLEAGSVRTVVGDLPYAQLLGSSAENAALYPSLVGEAARVLQRSGRLVLVTTQRRLLRSVLLGFAAVLRLEREVPFEVPHARGVIKPS